ncbi:MAG: AraC family transcriptional regulator [Verrucomicrobiota bacterium]
MQTLTYRHPKQALKVIQNTLEIAFLKPEIPELLVPQRFAYDKLPSVAPYHAFPEIFFQVSGTNRFACGPQTYDLEAGNVCIMPAALPHHELWLEHDFSAFVIVHDSTRFIILIMEKEEGERHWARPIRSYPAANGSLLAGLLGQTAESFQKSAASAPHLYRSYLGLIIEQMKSSPSGEINPYSPLVTQCMELLFAEMNSEELTLRAVADHLGCNADSLSARFSREVGQTAIQYLTSLRLEQARHLLRESQLTIAEVSWACGYQDPNYFSRLFKAQIGLSPRNYRQQNEFK